MQVKLTASLISPEDNKIVYLERDVELPFPPEPGLMLNGLHPDKDGWSLKVELTCWDHKAQKLNADVNPVCVDMGGCLDEEAHKWVTEGWKIVEIQDLYPEGDEATEEDAQAGGDPGEGDHALGEPAKGKDGGSIEIYNSVVNIYNGGTAEVDQAIEE